MGSYACYAGWMNIPEEKRDCFRQQMMKLLNYGGMMKLESVSMAGRELHLLSPLELSKEGEVFFWYNYFEERAWEDAGFNGNNLTFYSNKIGGCEFCEVIYAAYMLYEMYVEETGFALCDEGILDLRHYGGWLNQILGTEFSMEKRYNNLWENAEYIASLRIGHQDPFSIPELSTLISDQFESAGGTELADLLYTIYGTKTLETDYIVPGSYPDDVYQCKKALIRFREIMEDNFFEHLFCFLQMDRSEREKNTDTNLGILAELSLFLPARVFAYLAAEIENKPFWKLWKEWKDKVYHDEQMKQYASEELQEKRRELRKKIIPKIRTSEFLRQDGWFTFRNTPEELKDKGNYYLSDDDRMFWWDGTDEVVISDDVNTWLTELSDRHRGLMDLPDAGCGDKFQGPGFIEDFMVLLDEIRAYYRRICPFKTMFYDFIQNSEKKEYRAALALLKMLYEENKEEGKVIEYAREEWDSVSKNVTQNIARLRLKRYLSVMANVKLRKKYFNF